MSQRISRRRFLGSSLTASLSALAGMTIYPLLRYLWPGKGGAGLSQREATTIPVAQLSPGEAVITRVGGRPVIVVRADDEIHALSAVCTHLGCIVTWEEAQRRLFCPCHAGVFDLNGNVLGGPPPKPLLVYRAKIAGDQIVVEAPV